MLERIKTAAAETVDGRQPQCFVLFVLSHGGLINNQDVVFCPDGDHLTKQRIKNELSGTKSPNLREVPRILFFQCCRGGMPSDFLTLILSFFCERSLNWFLSS